MADKRAWANYEALRKQVQGMRAAEVPASAVSLALAAAAGALPLPHGGSAHYMVGRSELRGQLRDSLLLFLLLMDCAKGAARFVPSLPQTALSDLRPRQLPSSRGGG